MALSLVLTGEHLRLFPKELGAGVAIKEEVIRGLMILHGTRRVACLEYPLSVHF